MHYPAQFPPESRAAVAAEKLRAGHDFDKLRETLPRMQYGVGPDLEAALRKYILRQFSVFAREACALGLRRTWHVDRVEKEALEFLRLSTIDATSSKGYDKSGRAFGRDWTSNWDGSVQPPVMRLFERSDEWQQFQEALLEVAEAQTPQASVVSSDSPEEEFHKVTQGSEQTERNGSIGPIATATVPSPELNTATTGHEPDRSELVDAFLFECNREPAVGFKVIRKHIWRAAGHARARQFQYWQEGSPKATPTDDRNIRRILDMSPASFIALLKQRGISLLKF